MVTTATSNGMLLDERRLEGLGGVLDLLAISLDGVPASHDRVRAHPGAFAAMAGRLPGVRSSGIPFGFIFTLTQHNLHELDWVAQFALEQGASLLQIHPLEEVGRAAEQMAGTHPDPVELAFAFLAAARLRTLVGGAIHVQLDLVDRDALGAQPERVFADTPGVAEPGGALADLVSPIIIEADGEVVPIQYGFPRRFGLGNLNEAPLVALMARWRLDRCAEFRRICRATFDDLMLPAELPLANWYDALGAGPRRPRPPSLDERDVSPSRPEGRGGVAKGASPARGHGGGDEPVVAGGGPSWEGPGSPVRPPRPDGIGARRIRQQ